MHGSEVWSPFVMKKVNDTNFLHLCDNFALENVHTKFCKYLLYVNRYSSNAAVKGELGRYPVLTGLLCHSVKYYMALRERNDESLVLKSYQQNCNLADKNIACWYSCLRHLLGKMSHSDILCTESQPTSSSIKSLENAL